jgi:D-amino-acid dehydrogenase
VLAAGAWSGPLAKRFGFRLPIEAGKGYSVTISNPAVRLARPVLLGEVKLGCTPFDGALRVAGTMELSGLNTRLDPRRVAAIRRAADRYLPGSLQGTAVHEWTGMRPVLPDGLPAIGRAPGFQNLYVASGHAMLGITLAPATAEVLADLMTTERSAVDLRAFDPGRYR